MAKKLMASARALMTRSSSSDSSAFSNIVVNRPGTPDSTVAWEDAFELAGVSVDVSPRASMNPSTAGEVEDDARTSTTSRPRRVRVSNPIYDIKQLSRVRRPRIPKTQHTGPSRAGRTSTDELPKLPELETSEASPKRRSSGRISRSLGVPERMKKAACKVSTVLGKRTREVMEGKRRLRLPKEDRVMRELDTGKKGVLDELDLDADATEYGSRPLSGRPGKRSKITKPDPELFPVLLPTAPLVRMSDGKRVKKWQTEGLYVGQGQGAVKLEAGLKGRAPVLPLPMFDYLDKTRSFIIPFDIYASSLRKGDEKPKDWKMLNRNRLIGEAKDLWEKEDRLPASACVCDDPLDGEGGCGDDCLNRVMQYECNADNCRLSVGECSNRAFAELQARREKGGLYNIGVEIVKTDKCGFGIRATRSFNPFQIIMEYTGEIISEAECQRRMREDYKNNKSYYLMELERNLVIDGTKGSMARFINHSCDPNCEVRMVKVNGTPRMGVFAGPRGITTGDELSYDYNFDNFGDNQQACHCGARNCRKYLSRRLNAAEQKKRARLDDEREREATEEAERAAAAAARRKRVKTARGSTWRGWVSVDDDGVKAELRLAKIRRGEAEQNSDRARRLAARSGSDASIAGKKGALKSRRRTTGDLPVPPARRSSRASPKAAPATVSGSRFVEVRSRASSTGSPKTVSTAAELSEHGAEVVYDLPPVEKKPQRVTKRPSRPSLKAKRDAIAGDQVTVRAQLPAASTGRHGHDRSIKSFFSSVSIAVKQTVSTSGRSGVAAVASTNVVIKQNPPSPF